MPLFETKQDNFTMIKVILDRSGSMKARKKSTIEGFNEFLGQQKALEGKATLSLIQFDDQYEVHYNNINIQEVPELDEKTFVPRGMTALLDAIGKTIDSTKKEIAEMKNKPANVLFFVITDGEENQSEDERYKQKDYIKEMITKQEEEDKWDFMFLGADQNAWASAQAYGFQSGKTMSYDGSDQGTKAVFNAVSKGVMARRAVPTAGLASLERSVFFDDEDYEVQASLGVSNDQVQTQQ